MGNTRPHEAIILHRRSTLTPGTRTVTARSPRMRTRACGLHAHTRTAPPARAHSLACTHALRLRASERASVRGFTLVQAAAASARVHTSLRDPSVHPVSAYKKSAPWTWHTHERMSNHDTRAHAKQHALALAAPFLSTRSACSWQLDARSKNQDTRARLTQTRACRRLLPDGYCGDGNDGNDGNNDDGDEDRLTRAMQRARRGRLERTSFSLSALSRAEKSGKIDRRPGAAPTETPLAAAAAFSLPLSPFRLLPHPLSFSFSLSLCLSLSLQFSIVGFLCRSGCHDCHEPLFFPFFLWPLFRLSCTNSILSLDSIYLLLSFLPPLLLFLTISFFSTKLGIQTRRTLRNLQNINFLILIFHTLNIEEYFNDW